MADEQTVIRTPRLVLIAGATGTGKSRLAHMIAHEMEFSRCVSTDTIREVLRVGRSPNDSPDLHRSSYSHGTTGDPINDWLDACNPIQPGISAVINRARSQGIDLVLEGVHLIPQSNWIREWRESGGRAVGIYVTADAEAQHRGFIVERESSSYRGSERYMMAFERIRAIQRAMMERGRLAEWIRIDPLLHEDPLIRVRQNLM